MGSKVKNRSVRSLGVGSLSLLSLVGGLVIATPAAIAVPGDTTPVEVINEETPQTSAFTVGDNSEEASDASVFALGSEEQDAEEAAQSDEGDDALEESEGEEPAEEDASIVLAATKAAVASKVVTRCKIPAGKYGGSFSSGQTRLGGSNRYATSVGIAQKVASSPQGSGSAVFVASGASFADGLALGALAAKAGWPLLLVQPDSLGTEVAALVQKQKPTHIYIAGGTGAVSSKVEEELKALGASGVTVERFGGKDRYETSAKIASCFDVGAPAFVTTGVNFADAVVAGAPAAKLGGPVILTPTGAINSAAASALSSVKSSEVYLIGGTWSSAQQSAAKSAAGASSVSVVSGKNRYATSAAVANTFFGTGAKPVVYATGLNFPDALSGISAAKVAGAPIVLTKTSCRPSEIEAITKTATSTIFLGGSSTVADTATTTTCAPPVQVSASSKIVDYAKQHVGKAYVYGASGPNTFDCSGLTSYVYRQAGISIPRTTWGQLEQGTKVASPQPGDIVVLNGGGHVGIYVSKGMMIDAGNPRVGVSLRAIYATPLAYVRFA